MARKKKRKTISFQTLLNTVTKKEFEDFYFTHSKETTLIYFRIGSTVFNKFMHYYSIVKPKEKINQLREATNIEIYGVANQFQRVEHIQEGYIRVNGSLEAKYKKGADTAKRNAQAQGFNSMSQTPEVQARRRQTCMARFNRPCSIDIEKSKQTKLSKYGDAGYHNIEQIKQTNLKNIGCMYNFASDNPEINGRGTYHKKLKEDLEFRNSVISKRKSTCKNKFEDDYYLNQVELMTASMSSHNNSNVNKEIKAYLLSLGLMFDTEFRVNNYIYDFKFGNYLVEINPYATHNSTWGIFNNSPKDKEYHRNKTLNAISAGYKCIHVFDWMDINSIVWGIMNHKITVSDRCYIKPYYFNIKTKKLEICESNDTVTIWDDGFDVVVEGWDA